jgi:DNA-binding response OmpR family regulator
VVHGRQILVVDGDPATRRSVRLALEGIGYAVARVATGEAALAWLAETRPDLAVLAVHTPGLDGWNVLERLRGRDWLGDRVPVVVLLDRVIDRTKAFRYGADHYLLKPFGPDKLVARIAATLMRTDETYHDCEGACRPWPVVEETLADESEAA